jgi:hypothetical protein
MDELLDVARTANQDLENKGPSDIIDFDQQREPGSPRRIRSLGSVALEIALRQCGLSC